MIKTKTKPIRISGSGGLLSQISKRMKAIEPQVNEARRLQAARKSFDDNTKETNMPTRRTRRRQQKRRSTLAAKQRKSQEFAKAQEALDLASGLPPVETVRAPTKQKANNNAKRTMTTSTRKLTKGLKMRLVTESEWDAVTTTARAKRRSIRSLAEKAGYIYKDGDPKKRISWRAVASK